MIEISFLANGRCERKARQVKARRAQDKARYDISDQASGAEGSANTCTYRKLKARDSRARAANPCLSMMSGTLRVIAAHGMCSHILQHLRRCVGESRRHTSAPRTHTRIHRHPGPIPTNPTKLSYKRKCPSRHSQTRSTVLAPLLHFDSREVWLLHAQHLAQRRQNDCLIKERPEAL